MACLLHVLPKTQGIRPPSDDSTWLQNKSFFFVSACLPNFLVEIEGVKCTDSRDCEAEHLTF